MLFLFIREIMDMAPGCTDDKELKKVKSIVLRDVGANISAILEWSEEFNK